MNQTINQTLGNRVAIKDNKMSISDRGEIYIYKDDQQGMSFPIFKITELLQTGGFENFVTVFIGGGSDGGSCGPGVKPNQKGINRLLRIIKQTNYRIVSQNGQYFTIEGSN
jgi:hypothetical protein